ncbi:MAG: hypothetical protein Phyf2KO_27020 [Phycisphaerales bacterium]
MLPAEPKPRLNHSLRREQNSLRPPSIPDATGSHSHLGRAYNQPLRIQHSAARFTPTCPIHNVRFDADHPIGYKQPNIGPGPRWEWAQAEPKAETKHDPPQG